MQRFYPAFSCSSASHVPHAACPRRLCQPPWTQPTRRETHQTRRGIPSERKTNAIPSRSSGGSAREALLAKKRPPRIPPRPPRRMSAAALSAAVDSTNSQETAPNSQGHTVRKKKQCNPQPFFGWEREGGASCKEAASLAFPLVPPRRRGLNLLAGNRAQLTGAYCPKEKPIQSPAVLRVGARGRRFLQRSGLPRIPPHVPSLVKYCNFVISVGALVL